MSDLLADERLAEIRARAEAATPGPWEAEVHDGFCINGRPAECLVTAGNHLICKMLGPDAVTIYHPTTGFSTGNKPGANAAFIAHAREDIPALLGHVKALDAALCEARDALEECASALELCRDEPDVLDHAQEAARAALAALEEATRDE